MSKIEKNLKNRYFLKFKNTILKMIKDYEW
jgi:hypothetical protein